MEIRSSYVLKIPCTGCRYVSEFFLKELYPFAPLSLSCRDCGGILMRRGGDMGEIYEKHKPVMQQSFCCLCNAHAGKDVDLSQMEVVA